MICNADKQRKGLLYEEEDAFEEPYDLEVVLGYVPDPLDSCYESPYEDGGNMFRGSFATQGAADDSFPSKYVLDAVVGKPSRKQNPFGTCWAFATMSAVELSAKQRGIAMPGGGVAGNSTDRCGRGIQISA